MVEVEEVQRTALGHNWQENVLGFLSNLPHTSHCSPAHNQNKNVCMFSSIVE